ncbi:MAG: cyclophilin-like fold protein [Oscillospiraceae bacterium]|nr:hypothetical protein [Bacillota bacterium]
MRRPAALALAALLALTLAACGARPTAETDTPTAGPSAAPAPVEPLETSTEEETEMKMNVEVGGESFTATLENNSAAAALAEMLRSEPLTIEMSDYAGFEKVGSLGTRLPASNAQTTTSSGDIVLYNGSQIVIFYGSNSWSYTRLGRIDDLDGWADALGSGDVTVTFSLTE